MLLQVWLHVVHLDVNAIHLNEEPNIQSNYLIADVMTLTEKVLNTVSIQCLEH